MCVFLLTNGCKRGSNSFDLPANSSSWRSSESSARELLTEIPPPSKGPYLAIRHESQWQNPFLTVNRKTIQVRIYLPDENTSSFDQGGLTRTKAARRLVLEVRLSDLPRALSSLPNESWPYGRVVAMQEGLETAQDRARLTHNVEVTMRTLNDLGIVVDDWTGFNPGQ